eukprot:TRINITY_DN54344_c0_g1_i1.p1 TRINITY_DN54344_c0_g1~~TRINITY_DN54344_c0_g1_i1.p1  ORF type:complete len:506 (-),score=112.42 TRINITY_DN54344_c0_g1_i1:211-1728(-)
MWTTVQGGTGGCSACFTALPGCDVLHRGSLRFSADTSVAGTTSSSSSSSASSWLHSSSPRGGASEVIAVTAGLSAAAACSATHKKRLGRRRTTSYAEKKRGPVSLDEVRFPILSKRSKPVGSYAGFSGLPQFPASVHPGVITGESVYDLFEFAKACKFAIPAVNVCTSSTINAALETARKMDAPVILQLSPGGAQFYAGRGLSNIDFHAAIAGAVSAAFHARAVAEQYGVPVLVHTDYCSRELLPWLDGLLDADERYFEKHGESLFSSHMLDLSDEPLEDNLAVCKTYLRRMAKLGVCMEVAVGVTGGKKNGASQGDEVACTTPEDVLRAYTELSEVEEGIFTVAAAFGNFYGLEKRSDRLKPELLGKAQKLIASKSSEGGNRPVSFVFPGSSGLDADAVHRAIDYGAVKVNIDTDMQWAYWSGIKGFEEKHRAYLQTQIGNPDGAARPNKKYYDPRASLRAAEQSFVKRLSRAFEDCRCVYRLGLAPPGEPQNVLGPRRGALPT